MADGITMIRGYAIPSGGRMDYAGYDGFRGDRPNMFAPLPGLDGYREVDDTMASEGEALVDPLSVQSAEAQPISLPVLGPVTVPSGNTALIVGAVVGSLLFRSRFLGAAVGALTVRMLAKPRAAPSSSAVPQVSSAVDVVPVPGMGWLVR